MKKRQSRAHDTAPIPQLTDEQLRREMNAWPQADVVEFLVDLIQIDPTVRARYHLRASAQVSAPAAAVNNFKSSVDRVLNINFVEWSQVSEYIERLEGVLADIVAFGAKAPSEALEVALYFMRAIPSIFDSIHDETELATFCEELSANALSLQSKAGSALSSVAPHLLDAFLRDDHGRFAHIPGQLASHCLASDRKWLRDEVTRRRAGANPYQISRLDAIAGNATDSGQKKPKLRR